MKYVKGISLFFVYPACCFLIGLMAGFIVCENNRVSGLVRHESEIQGQDLLIEREEDGTYEPVRSADETTIRQEEIMPGQYVMNPNAIQEMPAAESDGEENGYFISIADDGCVIVYHGDRQTIFLTTDIKAEELPADVQADLEDWMYMVDEGMLYDFLENYTS